MTGRDRLAAALDEGVLRHPVTLVVAPAGYGKTTAVRSWARERTDVAWIDVDAALARPLAAFRAISAALASVSPDGVASRLAHLAGQAGDGCPAPWPDLLDGLVATLDDAPRTTVLVLDDVHRMVPAEPNALAHLVRVRHPTLRLVLVARHDPPLALQRLRLDDALAELRADELALTVAEVGELLAADGVAASDADVRELARRTRGWPAAVALMLALTRNEPGLPDLPEAHEPLIAYLSDQVLAALPPDVAAFVLDAATSDRLTAPLARALAGERGPVLLDASVRLGVFLERDGDMAGEPVYRWQPVFARHARTLRRRTDPGRSRALHLRAAEHWAVHDPRAAVAHANVAGDVDLAARITLDSAWELLAAGEGAMLTELADASADSDTHAAALALVRAACAYAAGDVAAGDRALASAPRAPATDVTRAVVELLARDAGSTAPDDDAMRRGSLLVGTPAAGRETGLPASLLLQLGRARGGTAPEPDAVELLRAARREAAAGGARAIELAAAAELSLATVVAHPGSADALARDVLGAAARHGLSGAPALAAAHLTRGLDACWRDDLPGARDHLSHVGRGEDLTSALAATVLAVVDVGSGQAGDDRPVPAARWPALDAVVRAHRLAAKGDAGGAVAVLEACSGGPRLAVTSVWEAELLRQGGARTAALRVLDAAGVPAGGHLAVAAGLTRVLAVAGPRAVEPAVHEPLERILAAASALGSLRPFVERAGDLGAPLAAHLARGTAHEAFLTAALTRTEQPRARHPETPWDLTERELEVLSYLRSSMTTSEIADALGITMNTVKTHQRAIYRKLGVGGRREALRLAEDRGLLTPAHGIPAQA